MPGDLIEEYKVQAEHTPFYTGGDVLWTADGSQLLCPCESNIKKVELSSGNSEILLNLKQVEAGDDAIQAIALSPDNEKIITAHRSGLIRLWQMKDGTLLKTWRSGHKGPVSQLAFDVNDGMVASAGCDGNIRLWDVKHQTCIGSLKQATGVFSVLIYHPNPTKFLIFGAADDTKIRSWNSQNGEETHVFAGHFSKVTAIQFTNDSKYMISSGRDRVIILWSLEQEKAIKTIPVYECIEGLVILPNSAKFPGLNKLPKTEGIYVACAGEKGVIKVWNIQAGQLIHVQTNSLVSPSTKAGGLAITHLLFNEQRKHLCVVTVEHNIIIHKLETFECEKQMAGFADEVHDITFIGEEDTHIVVATNSSDLKYYCLATMNCELVKGHSDMVLALERFPLHPNVFVSSSKDKTVRVWSVLKSGQISCIAVGSRHTAAVGAVCTAKVSANFFVSVSQDNCLKCWEMPKSLSKSKQKKLKTLFTVPAHEMDINCVAVSPNDKVIATGSQDKTAKLFSAEDFKLLGVLKGHKRGIWCVKFSPVDQVILTTSSDSTIKLWSLNELNCLKSFEGHESSVLQAEFLTKGLQIVSSGSDGLVKLWNIKSSECTLTMERHEGVVWAITTSRDEKYLITGGSDSMLIIWKDVTEENREQKIKESEESVLLEQELMNLLHKKSMVKALKLAIRLNRPFKALHIINDILKDDQNKLKDAISKMKDTEKEALLKFAVQWNTNAKNCHAAQIVIHLMAPDIMCEEMKIPGLPGFIESMLPYTERHFERLTALLQDLRFIEYTVNCMQPSMK